MNPKENKVLSEYFKKIEKAEQAVLQSNDIEAILYFLENALISDKTVDYLFHFADKKYKMLFLNSQRKFTPAQQVSICNFGTADMIKQLIDTLGNLKDLLRRLKKYCSDRQTLPPCNIILPIRGLSCLLKICCSFFKLLKTQLLKNT